MRKRGRQEREDKRESSKRARDKIERAARERAVGDERENEKEWQEMRDRER